MQTSSNFTRRDFLKLAAAISVPLTVFSVGGTYYSTKIEPAWLDIESVTIKLPNLRPAFDGLRLTQISDIHMGGWMNREQFEHVIDLVKGTYPDLILMTGDFVEYTSNFDRALGAVQDVQDVLSSLNSMPALAILGNHDYRSGVNFYLRAMFSRLKIVDLTNGVHTMVRGEGQLHFAGLDDLLMGFPDFNGVLAKLPQNGAAILLAHEPDFADISSLARRFDLQISGHSHGGQVVLPIVGPPILPSMGEKYVSGLYRVGTMFQYTNRGVGMTEPYIRFNCRPEITVFNLKAA